MNGVWNGGPNRRMDVYLGVTNASGVYSVTYAVPFPVGKPPSVQPSLTAGPAGRMWRVSASTETGFTVTVEDRAAVTVLAVQVLGIGFTAAVGQALTVVVVAQD